MNPQDQQLQNSAPSHTQLTLAEITPGMRVAYIGGGRREWGTVSSKNDHNVFVRFDEQVAKLGWDGTTSQACSVRNLVN